ncbi:MAG: protein phosphatase [Planctomycetaceae bacterium]|nr:protein phosphatase [Planctomycetaceae bacterium]
MLGKVIDAARAVLNADRGTVFLYDAETNELFSTIATGSDEMRFPADVGIAGECAQRRQVINVPDCYADQRFNPEFDRKTGYRTRCLLTVPLIGFDDTLVGVMQIINKLEGVFDATDEQMATALAAQCAVALQRARLIDAYVVKQKLERDLALAREIQSNVLPEKLPDVPGYDLAGWNTPADETGGDIYDGVALDEHRAALLLADATGHGIGPALSVTQFRAMFRISVRLSADLDTAFVQINDQLTEDLPGNRFVTAFVGQLDGRAHQIRYHAGGQGPLLHFHAADQTCTWLEASTLPMGIIAGLTVDPSPDPIDMAPGDIFALISDGIYEYQNAAGEQFDNDRVGQVFKAGHEQTMEALIMSLRAAVAAFAGDAPQNDDMTVVLIKRLG